MRNYVMRTILLSTLLIAGCASAPIKAMTGAYAACSKADLGQIVTSDGKTLLDDVASEIKGNKSTLEDDLKGLIGKATLDAVICAVVAVEAALTAPADTTTPSTSQQAPIPGLIRAKAFIAAQKS